MMRNHTLFRRRSYSMEYSSTSQRRLSLVRLIFAIAIIGCIIHLTHRECVINAFQPFSVKGMFDKSVVAPPAKVKSGHSEVFHATAYCVAGTTRSGAPTAPGLVSADPTVIPLGSMIYVESPLMGGVYQVLDTGELVKGKIIDIFIPSYEKCVEFGRRMVKVKVLRYGFHNEKPLDPKKSAAK
jgi:3D (Asp-Asp-Asp) domain-containing protein